jgi:hypothetical protein
MPVRLLPPGWQQDDANGNPVSGAQLYTYEPGTTTPKPTYSDAARTILNANPVVADSGGVFGPVFADFGQYRLVMETPTAAPLWDADPVDGEPPSTAVSTLDNTEPVLFNSTFTVWQRGTTVAIPASTSAVTGIYGPDGWSMNTSASQNCTISQQAGITDDARYCMRVQRDSGQTGTGVLIPQQWIPTDHIAQLRGKLVTFSTDVRVGANFSGSLRMWLICGTGAEGRRPTGSTYTNESNAILSGFLPITTSTQRFTFTTGAVIPANTTQMTMAFEWTPAGTAGAADYFEIGRPVLAPSPGIDPPFVSDAYELERAQRWYWVSAADIAIQGNAVGGGDSSFQTVCFPTTMRATPTVSATFGSGVNVGSTAVISPSINGFQPRIVSTIAGSFSAIYSAGNTADARL